MKLRSCALVLALSAAAFPAPADDTNPYKVSVTTLITTPLVIEGLTNDNDGNLYAPGRATAAGQPCPVWKVNVRSPVLTVVGQVPAPSATGSCSPSGLAFGPDAQLYVTQTDSIYRFTPSESSPPTATLFASNVPGTAPDGGTPNSAHLPAYAQVNVGVAREFQTQSLGKLGVRFSIVNLFDKIYEIRDGTGVGVGAPQFGPRRSLYATISAGF